MEKKKTSRLYKILLYLLKLVYPKMEAVGTENLPDEPALIIGNHAQMDGPLSCELRFPIERYTWCAAPMMHLKEVPAYAFQDFWSEKPKYIQWFFKLASYVIAPLSVLLFNNANTIGVYRDARIMSTIRETMAKLQAGVSVVIFPECNEKFNNIIYNFQEGFVDVARFYHRKHGVELSFVPMYIAPHLKKICFGKPIRFCAATPYDEERKRIREELMAEITALAANLPEHTVVPYRNMPKKDSPKNLPIEVYRNEETAC